MAEDKEAVPALTPADEVLPSTATETQEPIAETTAPSVQQQATTEQTPSDTKAEGEPQPHSPTSPAAPAFNPFEPRLPPPDLMYSHINRRRGPPRAFAPFGERGVDDVDGAGDETGAPAAEAATVPSARRKNVEDGKEMGEGETEGEEEGGGAGKAPTKKVLQAAKSPFEAGLRNPRKKFTVRKPSMWTGPPKTEASVPSTAGPSQDASQPAPSSETTPVQETPDSTTAVPVSAAENSSNSTTPASSSDGPAATIDRQEGSGVQQSDAEATARETKEIKKVEKEPESEVTDAEKKEDEKEVTEAKAEDVKGKGKAVDQD
ncbi:hypothetical protein T439DRAFT_372784 [Meredithblackwellia eburnea MCA 4105]